MERNDLVIGKLWVQGSWVFKFAANVTDGLIEPCGDFASFGDDRTTNVGCRDLDHFFGVQAKDLGSGMITIRVVMPENSKIW